MSIFVCSFQQYYYYYTKDPVVYLGLFGFIGSMFAIGLAVGVFLAVGMLFVIQIRSILKNETGIESWIIEKVSVK
jgi:palmitoyltransferase